MTPYEQVQPYLRTGEQLLWSGAPDPRVSFTPSDAFLIPFSIMWGGFAIFWESSVWSSDAPVFFRLWGVPFVLVGLYFIFGRFFFKRHQKQRTVYAITDQRAIVLNGNTLTDSPVKNQQSTVKWSRDRSHVSVIIGATIGAWGGTAMAANSGMGFFQPRYGPTLFGLFDVADATAMLQALDRARQ